MGTFNNTIRWLIYDILLLTFAESLDRDGHYLKIVKAGNVPDMLKTATRTPTDSEIYHDRIKRSSPLLTNDYDNCFSQPNCADVSNMTSMASATSNVIYIATQGRILKVHFADSNSTCVCTTVYNETEPALSITMDDEYIYWLSEARTRILYLSIGSENGLFSQILSPEMLAEDKKLHRAACKIPPYVPEVPSPLLVSATHAKFNLSGIKAKQYDWFNSTVCLHEESPNITFAFLYKKSQGYAKDQTGHFCFPSSGCLYKRVGSRANLKAVTLGNLSPNTDYLVHIVIYSTANYHKSAVVSPARHFSTKCTVSSPPNDLSCQGLNNSALRLSWDEPEQKNSDEILYQIYSSKTTRLLTQFTVKSGGGTYADVNLEYAQQNYTVRVVPVDCVAARNQYNEALVTGCRPLHPPVDLSIDWATNMQVQLLWQAPDDAGVQFVIVEWIKLEGQDATTSWASSRPIDAFETFHYTVTDLIPNTGYSFRTRQQYIGHAGNDGWFYSNPVNGKTMPGVPGFPYDVRVVERSEAKYLTWTQPDANGAPLEYYIISYRNRSSPNASRILFGPWIMIRDISARSNDWEIKTLLENVWYEFRVSAVNSVGEGDASEPSSPFLYSTVSDTEDDATLWIILGATGGLVMLIIILILVVGCRRCGQVSDVYRSPSSSEITTIHLNYGMDLQLAQLRHVSELASIRGVSSVPQDYMDLLPLFPREKLELTSFLGKGAFGEVFRGIARDINGETGSEKRVAVKTLREGSTDSEKCEFLMEAYFMSNFDHQNILSLLGVCLDNEPQYLIMELMEGGDLLHYLRDARANPIMGPKLTTTDRLDICLDVAAGCKYLEDQRFIHRDLAARNCLVSTKMYATENRVVKIGDFGLARDIYRNDYYHKVGEGLLPVRWMAPESLLDNLYTTQSDIWAFGVLLWEIMSFGLQPYPTYTNIEVLQHVRAGGRLQKPENCPSDIYALMTKCWHNIPTLRPSFNWALQWLQDFKQRNLTGGDSDYDLSMINYATVTTSDEDFIDDDETQSPPRSPSLERNAARGGHENSAFVPNEYNLRNVTRLLGNRDTLATSLPAHEMDVISSGMDTEHTSATNGSGYLHVSEDPHVMRVLSSPAAHQHNENITDVPADPSNDLNYSILNFPPSRNQSQKSNGARGHHNEGCTCTRSSSVEGSCSQMDVHDILLPYMGDLPITDEERLLRKRQWSRQTKVQISPVSLTTGNESPTGGQDGRVDNSDSPYLRGLSVSGPALYRNDDVRGQLNLPLGEMNVQNSSSDQTFPKQLFQEESPIHESCLEDNLNDAHERTSPHNRECTHHRRTDGEPEYSTVCRQVKRDRDSVDAKTPYANIATYV